MVIPTLWRNTSPSMWDEIFSVRRDFDRLLDRYVGHGSGETLSAWAPMVDVKESRDDIVITAELPGVEPDDVNVTVQNGVLVISGEKRDEHEEKHPDSNAYVIERRYGRFERSFALPRTVNADSVLAEFNNGVLRIRLPKTEQAKPRRIEVQGGESKKREVSTGSKRPGETPVQK